MYSIISGIGEIQEDELDSCVADYVHPPRIDLPECSLELSDILEIYKDLFSSIPGVAKVQEFRIRTDNSRPVKIPPRLLPQAYFQEVQSQIKEMCERNVIIISNSPCNCASSDSR